MIDLSIVVPLYNTEKYIARCLDSLLDQDIPPDQFEIIVINDGTPDEGRSVVEGYVEKHPQIRLFDQPNSGLYIARNRGISLARGKYIYFIDSDDFIAPKALGPIVSFMKAKQLDIFGFGIVTTSEDKLPPVQYGEGYFNPLEPVSGPEYIATSKFRNEAVWYVADREFLIDIDLKFGKGHGLEDGIFTAELIYHSRSIVTIPLEIYGYYQRPESTMHTDNSARNRYLLKGYEVAAQEFKKFYDRIKPLGVLNETGLQRIKSKQQSYIFFLLIRVVKSDLTFREMDELLARLRTSGFYPIHDFIGPDYSKPVYRILVLILNNKLFFYPAVSIFRTLKKLKGK